MLRNTLKTYTAAENATYHHTTMVRHDGTVIAFAMDSQRRISYSVLDLSPKLAAEGDQAGGEPVGGLVDKDHWLQTPKELPFPSEVAKVGYRDQSLVALERVEDEDGQRDPFRSSTARLTADAPFEVLSDGRFIYLFRQSVDRAHPDAKERNEVIVDNRILVDRFVFVGNELVSKTEVRFQRSRHKTKPQSDNDSLSSKDLDGNFFYEPTQKLEFAHHVKGGRFSALLMPTSIPDRYKWQIFAHNDRTGRIEHYSVERDDDGLFDTLGTANPARGSDYPGTCLRFVKANAFALLGDVRLDDRSFTIELWAKRASRSGQDWIIGQGHAGSGHHKFLHIGFRNESAFSFGFYHDDVTVEGACTDDDWHHWACVYDKESGKKLIYRDGKDLTEGGKGSKPYGNEGEDPLVLGRIGIDANQHFRGDVDEVRVWTVARSQASIGADGRRRLLGDEPGLCGYWRFDEGSGLRVHDQTEHDHDGKLRSEVEWVASTAPIGEHPGVDKSSVSFTDRAIVGGPCAQLYYQQEAAPAGYDGKDKPLKQGARVMLAVPTKASEGEPMLATVDFGVSRKGGLARAPSQLALSVLSKGEVTGAGLQRAVTDVAAIEAKLREIRARIRWLEGLGSEEELKEQLEKLKAERVRLQQERAAAQSNPLNYWCILKKEDLGRMLSITTKSGIDYAHLDLTSDPNPHQLHWRFEPSGGVGRFRLQNRHPEYASKRLAAHGDDALAWVVVDDVQRAGPRAEWSLERGAGDTLRNLGRQGLFLRSVKWWFDYWAHLGPNDSAAKWKIEKAPGNEAVNDEVSRREAQLLGLVPKIARLEFLVENIREFTEELEKLKRQVEVEQPKLRDAKQRLEAQQPARELPLPLVSVDPLGLTTTGGLLDFVSTTHAPRPFDGADGRLVLLCQGPGQEQGALLAARFDSSCARARYEHPTSEGDQRLLLVSRHPGPEMDTGVTISITDGKDATSCTVKLSSETLRIEETWEDVRRDPFEFAKILNGRASGRDKDPDYYHYSKRVTVKNMSEGAIMPFDPRRGSLLFTSLVPAQSKEIDQWTVTNAEVTAAKSPGKANHWVADVRHDALAFDGRRDYVHAPEHGSLTDLPHELTMEAWIQPGSVTSEARIIHGCSEKSRYVLGLRPRAASSALQLAGNKEEYVSCGHDLNFRNRDFTVEFWAKRASPGDYHAVIGQGANAENKGLQIGFWKDGRFGISFFYNDVHADSKYSDQEWHHWVCVVRAGHGLIYRDGVLVKKPTKFKTPYEGVGDLWIGRGPHPEAAYAGMVDEIRIWSYARSEQEIKGAWHRTLEEREIDPGKLLGYWHSGYGQLLDHSGHERHGQLFGKPSFVSSPVRTGFAFLAGHGNTVVATTHAESLAPPRSEAGWIAASAVFQQSYALEFDGKSARHVDCGKGKALDVRDDLTIEATIQLTDVSRDMGLLAKGQLGDEHDHGVPYSLLIEKGGKLVFCFEDVDASRHSFTSTVALGTAHRHRIALTRRRQTSTIFDENGKFVKEDAWTTHTFYVDGAEAGSLQYRGANVRGNAEALELGRARHWDGRVLAFNGFLMDVRLWNVARTVAEITTGALVSANDSGLVSWWRFEEAAGERALDTNGENHGLLVNVPKWVKNPDPTGSTFEIHINGAPRQVAHVSDFDWGSTHGFRLGAQVDPAPKALFHGLMDEVRIWNERRTPAQLQDTVFTRLMGKHEGLHAYYSFDEANGQEVKDRSGGQHDLRLDRAPEPERHMLSTAPVSGDAPQVRSALGGVPTPYQVAITSRPAAGEYGVLQIDVDGKPTGALKRCYAYVSGGGWHLPTGFKTGDLVAEWVGQVQYASQLIGFIEGAPPIPGENLTRKKDYSGASSIELEQSDRVAHTYSTSSDKGFDSAIEASGYLGYKYSVSAGTPFASAKVASSELKAGIKASFNHSNSSLTGAQRAEGRRTAKATKVALRGYPEQSAKATDSVTPFIPESVGHALVQSDTADLFSLRLANNGAFIAYAMQPNPEIPRDWNLITFPLDPGYVEQGKLKSYVRPDTGRLEKRIIREEQRLADQYAQLRLGAFDVPESLPNVAKRNLVNTYVWTADGGFFAETHQALDVVQETRGGSYAVGFLAGAFGDFNIHINAGIGFGGGFALSLMAGMHFNVTTTKTEEEEHALSLKVALDAESDIWKYENGKLVYKDGKPVRQPGKVDAYRFKTFYLQPDEEHFDALANEVVHQEWLRKNNSSAAQALRRAIHAQRAAADTDKAKPWRVLHRVTFVSPVRKQKAGDLAAGTLEHALASAEIGSDLELVERLAPYVRDHTGSLDSFTRAARRAIRATMPELVGFEDEVLPQLCGYFEVFE